MWRIERSSAGYTLIYNGRAVMASTNPIVLFHFVASAQQKVAA